MRVSQETISATLLQRPTGFTVGGRHYDLHPLTLGRARLTSGLTRLFTPDRRNASVNAAAELARMAGEHFEETLRLVAYATIEGRGCLDNELVAERAERLRKDLSAADLLTLFTAVLNDTGETADLQRHFGIDRDLAEYRRVCEAKGGGGSVTFCGRSVWGNVISPLAEKYGWTLDYILWDISLANIQMLLADAPKTLTLSDKDRERIRPRRHGDSIRADDPANAEIIKSMRFD